MKNSPPVAAADDQLRTETAAAAVLGCALAHGFVTQMGTGWATFFALFNEANWLREAGLLILFRLIMLTCFCLFPFRRWLFPMACIFLVTSMSMLFSGAGAFTLPMAMACVFCWFTLERPETDRKTASALMIATVFFLAVLQKMNSSYFSGDEFGPTGSFLNYAYAWGLPHDALTSVVRSWMAAASIVVELGICIGLLCNPVVFIHIAMLFAAVLALVHPPVIYVYAFFFPFAVLIDQNWSNRLVHSTPARALREPFFWCIAAMFVVGSSSSVMHNEFRVAPIAIVVGLIHIGILVRLIPSIQLSFIDVNVFKKAPRLLIAPGLAVLTFIAYQLGAPAPIGFSMFSGHKRLDNTHAISVSGREICGKIAGKWLFSGVVKAGISRAADGSCVVRFPTLSGLQGIREELCRLAPHAQWTVRNRGSRESLSENCAARVESSP